MEIESIRSVANYSQCECGICLNLYEDPRMLTCGHSFCLKCLKKQFSKNKSCALCRQQVPESIENVENLPKNHALRNILESLPSVASKCVLEDDESEHDHAEFLCLDCWDSLCLPCSRVHKMTKLTKSHVIKKLSDINQEDVDRHKRTQMSLCLKHNNQEYILYCNHCNELACALCFATCHLSYPCKCIELKVADKQFVSSIKREELDINCELNNLTRDIEKCKKPMEALKNKNEGVVSCYADLRQKIQDVCSAILDDIENTEKRLLGNIGKASEDFTNCFKQDEERLATCKVKSEFIKNLLLSSSSAVDRFIYLKQKKHQDNTKSSLLKASDSTQVSINKTESYLECLNKLPLGKVTINKSELIHLVGRIEDSRLQSDIVSILSLSGNCLFIGRRNSTKLSLYDLDNFQWIRYQHLKDGVQPTDVKVLENGNMLCASEKSKRVVLMSKNCSLINQTQMNEPVCCHISHSRDAVYVANGSDGIFVSRDEGMSWERIFYSPKKAHCYGVIAISSNPNKDGIYWVCENEGKENNDIFVLREYVVKWNKKGKMSFQYTNINLDYYDQNKESVVHIEPIYMAYDGGDCVYICDDVNDRLHAFNVSNKTHRLLSTSDNQLKEPSSLAVDEKRRRLYVGQADGQVLIFSLDDIRSAYNIEVLI